MRTTGLCSARFHFSSCAFFANNFAHSIFAMLAIADGVANSRFIGCLVALFFLQVLITVYNATSHPFKSCFLSRITKRKGEAEPLLFFWCGRQDLNLHDCSMDPKSIASAISPRPHFLAATFLSYNFTVLSTYRRLFIV